MKAGDFIRVVLLFVLPIGSMGQGLQLADSLRIKGEQFHDRGNFKEAEFYYNEAYNLYETHHDTASLLMTGIYFAEVLAYQSKMARSIRLFNFLKSMPLLANSDSLKARIESDLGWTYKQMGNLDKAQYHLKRSLSFSRTAKDRSMNGVALNNLASIYQLRGNFQKALNYFEQALSISELLNNKKDKAAYLSHIGSVYENLALYDRALDYYNQSLEIAKQYDDVNLLASMYYKWGGLQQKTSNYSQALMALEKSLKYRKQTNNIQRIGSTLNQIGLLYSDLGNLQKALEYFQESLSLWREASNPNQLAVAHKNIGNILWEMDKQKEAIQQYEQALALRKQSGRSYKLALSLIDLANVEINRKNYLVAKNHLTQVHTLAASLKNNSLKRDHFYWSGILESSQGNYSRAIVHFKKALEYSHSLEKDMQVEPLKKLAFAYNHIRSDSALYYGRRAINVIEEQRSQTGPLSEFKSGYFKQHADFYKDMAAWQLEYNNDASEAYRYVQLAKTRALNDELAAAAQRTGESLPEHVRIERGQMLSDISGLYQRLTQTMHNEKEQTALKDKIRQKELAYASFENQLREEYPQFKQFKSPDPVTLEEVRRMCGAETAVLEYAVTDQTLLIFLISRDQVRARQLLIKHQKDPARRGTNLREAVMQFREAITARASENSLRKLSQPVYDKIISPVESELANHKNVIIVPDGYLAYLPVEALSKDGNYLVRRYNIKYAPSMSGFSLIPEPKPGSGKKLLAIGNSNNYTAASEMSMLPTVDLEVQSILKLFTDHTLLDDNAITETAVKNATKETYSNIHIAAHSIIDEQNSFLSGIMLGKDIGDVELGNDGYLRTSEIYRLTIPSNMVVLSACKSGIGKLISGEGILGLQRAFFNAGTSTVVVSLWDVYDRSTTRFMQHFYSSMMHRDRSWSDTWYSFLRWTGWDHSIPFGQAASSIREAKLAMLHSPQYRHPVYWAPFIVVGR